MGPSSNATPHSAGEIAYDDTTDAVAGVTGSSAGTWRKLAGATTAGAFHAISPARIYDSRKPMPGLQAPLASGATRTVLMAHKRGRQHGGDPRVEHRARGRDGCRVTTSP